jgi:TetR/AcrR family transcriptional regulator, cholesterol catabolism regulator
MLVKTGSSRKKQIEEKATELFRFRGYAGTSMRDLARELDIEAGSLYSHIKSKEELLQSICFKMAVEFIELLKELETDEFSPAEKLKIGIIEHVKLITKDVSASAVFVNEWRHLSGTYLEKFLVMRENYEGKFIDIIREGIINKSFKEIDEKFAVQFIFSSVNWTYTWYKPTGKMKPGEIGEKLADLLIHGIKK